jgi:hypothetical protein
VLLLLSLILINYATELNKFLWKNNDRVKSLHLDYCPDSWWGTHLELKRASIFVD